MDCEEVLEDRLVNESSAADAVVTECLMSSDDPNDITDGVVKTCPFAKEKHSNDTVNDEGLDDEIGIELGDFNVDNLNEMLDNPLINGPRNKKRPVKTSKRMLAYRGQDYFNVLPDGWVEVTHGSGMPLYVHDKSRCCTFSRPYLIGQASVPFHRVPESAIPCLFYKRIQAEAEQRERDALEDQTEGGEHGNGNQTSTGRTEILQTAQLIQVKTGRDIFNAQLTPNALHEYAERRLKFKNINIYRFDEIGDDDKNDSTPETNDIRPGLSEDVTLITAPLVHKATGRPFFLNPLGRTSVCILNEISQRVLRCFIDYSFSIMKTKGVDVHDCIVKLPTNSLDEFLPKSSVNDRLLCLQERYRLENDHDSKHTIVGEGRGKSKKEARMMAAKHAIENLLGRIEFDSDCRATTATQQDDATSSHTQGNPSAVQLDEYNYELFDNLDVCDSRVTEWSARAGEPHPYFILKEYVRQNAGNGAIQTNMYMLPLQRLRFDMYVGESHHVSVECGNKREGKQKAAQAMLSKFLPECTTWGSILRLYGYEAQQKRKQLVKSQKNRRRRQDQICLEDQEVDYDEIIDESDSITSKSSINLADWEHVEADVLDGVCPAKRVRLDVMDEMVQLTAAQIEALEALLHVQKARLRNDELADVAILDDGQMRRLSAKLSQIFISQP